MGKELFINTRREGYSPEQCGKTLTAGELIKLLEEMDKDTPVYLRNDDGYTYGRITSYDIGTSDDFE